MISKIPRSINLWQNETNAISGVITAKSGQGNLRRRHDFNWSHQTTNLGVGSSNLFGRASLRDIPCQSHGIHMAVSEPRGHSGWFSTSTIPADSISRKTELSQHTSHELAPRKPPLPWETFMWRWPPRRLPRATSKSTLPAAGSAPAPAAGNGQAFASPRRRGIRPRARCLRSVFPRATAASCG